MSCETFLYVSHCLPGALKAKMNVPRRVKLYFREAIFTPERCPSPAALSLGGD